MTSPIYFVVSAIPKSLQALFDAGEPLPPAEMLETNLRLEANDGGWICQTFLRMKEAGLNVALVDRPIPEAICISHFHTMRRKLWAPDSFVVGIRTDQPPLYMREIEVVQNPNYAHGKDLFYLQYWPQSRLLPRDPARGDRIERISYFGGTQGIDDQFRSQEFKNVLQDIGVELNICYDHCQWHDYRNTDLILAIRNNMPMRMLKTKPASKLINTWGAGCVALLGNEPAFRAIGRSGENYFEIQTPQDVIQIVKQLKENPDRYHQMVQAGKQRYPDYNVDKVKSQWIEFLSGPVPEAFARWKQGIGRDRWLRRSRRCWQAGRQAVDQKLFWFQLSLEQNLLLSSNSKKS